MLSHALWCLWHEGGRCSCELETRREKLSIEGQKMLKVGDWYRHTGSDWHHAYQVVAYGEKHVVLRSGANTMAEYVERPVFGKVYEFIASAGEITL